MTQVGKEWTTDKMASDPSFLTWIFTLGYDVYPNYRNQTNPEIQYIAMLLKAAAKDYWRFIFTGVTSALTGTLFNSYCVI